MAIVALPETALAKWLLLVGVVSLFNTLQCLLDPSARLSRRVYAHQADQEGIFGLLIAFGCIHLALSSFR
jgi:hypothetical protein